MSNKEATARSAISTERAMKLALEALEAAYARLVTKCEQNLVTYNGVDVDTLTLSQEAITALREALAEQPAQQEPFGYFKAEPFGWTDCAETDEEAVALYERPPAQRTWVGLTDEEITDIWAESSPYYHEDDFARAIEAKLRSKNEDRN